MQLLDVAQSWSDVPGGLSLHSDLVSSAANICIYLKVHHAPGAEAPHTLLGVLGALGELIGEAPEGVPATLEMQVVRQDAFLMVKG